MTKQIRVYLLGGCFILWWVPQALARFGIGLTVGQWKVPDGDLGKDIASVSAYNAIQPSRTELKNDKLDGIIELLSEGQVTRGFRMGISVGYGAGPILKMDENYSISAALDTKHIVEVEFYESPAVSIYVKSGNKRSRFNVYTGGGVTRIQCTADVDYSSPLGFLRGEFKASKIATHAYAGFELFLSRNLALNASVRYLFSAIIDDFKSKLENSSTEYNMIMKNSTYGEFIDYKDKTLGLDTGERLFKMDYGKTPIFNFGLRYYFGKGGSRYY